MDNKKIKIFLGSSIVEFRDLRKELDDFVKDISKFFKNKYDFEVEILRCDDGTMNPNVPKESSQKEYIDPMIRQSEWCVFIIGTRLGEHTEEEYKLAFKLNKESNINLPRIAVFFNRNEENVDDSVRSFKELLLKNTNYEYYYPEFKNETDIKLSLVAGIKDVSNLPIEIKCEDGKCLVDGKVLFDIEDLHQININSDYIELNNQLKKIEDRYFELKPKYEDESTRDSVREEYTKIVSKRASLQETIADLKEKIFNMSLNMVEDVIHGEITPRLAKAYKYLDEGKYQEALSILNVEDILYEFEREERILIIKRETNAKNHIVELEARIDILETQTFYENRFEEILCIYTDILSIINRCGVKFDLLSEIIEFIDSQNFAIEKSNEIIEIIEKGILTRWEYKISDREIAIIYNSLGIFYDGLFNFDLAEDYFTKYKIIFEKLFKENTDKYCDDLVSVYINLAAFYSSQGNIKSAEDYYLKSQEICEELLKGNPNSCNRHLAIIFNNLGAFYASQGNIKSAEDYYLKSQEICEKLLKDQPEVYIKCLGDIYNNLGVIYKEQGNVEFVEEYLNKSKEIYEELAKANLDRYNGDLAGIYINLGVYYFSQNNFEVSENYYNKCKEILEKLTIGNPCKYNIQLCNIYKNLLILYIERGNIKSIEECFIKYKNLYEELAKDDPERYNSNLVPIYTDLGAFYDSQGNNDLAEEYYKKCKEKCEMLLKENPDKYSRDLAVVYTNLGVFYWNHGNIELAEECFAISKELSK